MAKYRPLTVVTWTFVFGTLGVLPFGAWPLIHAAPTLSPKVWGYVAYIVVSPTVGTYFLNMYALRRAPASLVAIYIYVQPIVGALMAAARLDERPAADTYVGGAFIGLGISFLGLAYHHHRRHHELLHHQPATSAGMVP